MESIKNNAHALLLLMAVLLFVGMSGNANVAVASRKIKVNFVDVHKNDDSAAAVPTTVDPAPRPQPQPATTTVTFFMHDVVGGPNPRAKPLSISGGSSSSLLNPSGLIPTTTAGGLLNLPFQNGGPFLNGIGPIIPAAASAGLLNPLLQNGPVLPLTFPNGFVSSSSTNPLLSGIGINNINGQNLQFNQFPASPNFPLTSQQGIPLINSPNLLNPLPNSPLPGVGTSGAIPLPLNQQGGQGLGGSGSEIIVIEDPLTEGPDESSVVVGKGEGYYMPSAKDPNTLLMTFTAKFEEGSEYEGGTIEFSGEDNTALPQRVIAVVGGSGKFQDAKGHALIETASNSAYETVLKFTVNLIY